MRWLALAAAFMLAWGGPLRAAELAVWAWERPEDLRFVEGSAEIVAQTGFIELRGTGMLVRGRRFPLLVSAGQPTSAVVHIQIDRRRPFVWTTARASQVAEAVLRLGRGQRVRRLQVDFEVRSSERYLLLAVLREVRDGLPPGVTLSMTALASWCMTEDWLAEAPVDEIVPMLFRMGPGGAAIRARLAGGGDFAEPRCRGALAISTDAPILSAPAGRRVYLFSPRSWTAADFARVRRSVSTWSGDFPPLD